MSFYVFCEIGEVHVAAFGKCFVECERRMERNRGLTLVAKVHVFAQQRTVFGICAILDDFVSALYGVVAAQVGDTLVGDNDVD